jgi:hypothetical protein
MPTISLASKTDSTVGQNESDLVDAGSLLRLSWHQNRVRVKSDFGRRINVIGLSSPSAKNILLPFFRNECFAQRSHPQEEGRLAIVTNVGGCGGRGSVVHVDGSQGGFVSGQSVQDERR